MRRALSLLLLLFAGTLARAGLADYTDHGRIDFDRAMQLLNPYGTWAEIDGKWAYTPLDHSVPYTNGRWLYTEFGWYWKGNGPTSWATEHYGYWKRGADHVWSWYPAPTWLPQIVEIRATGNAIGWRCAAVDGDGNFVEAPADRYAKTDEWSFVTKAQFTQPITPAVVAKPEFAARLLDDSSECMHVYTTYRPIDRPGPHPADFVALAGEDGMFAPRVENEPMPASPPPVTDAPPKTSPSQPAPGKPAPSPSGVAAAKTTTTNAAPEEPVGNDQSGTDLRQVHYWITMSLPTYWTPPPADAKPREVYIYRPDFYQDEDGIERRIRLWLNPASRALQGEQLQSVLNGSGKNPAVAPAPSSSSAFRNPFDESFHENSKSEKSALPPNSPATNSAPSGHQ